MKLLQTLCLFQTTSSFALHHLYFTFFRFLSLRSITLSNECSKRDKGKSEEEKRILYLCHPFLRYDLHSVQGRWRAMRKRKKEWQRWKLYDVVIFLADDSRWGNNLIVIDQDDEAENRCKPSSAGNPDSRALVHVQCAEKKIELEVISARVTW